jgi:nucleoside 2-deoxyribosyltransferase
MNPNKKCYFCPSTVTDFSDAEIPTPKHMRSLTYKCQICGSVWLMDEFLEIIGLERENPFSQRDKAIIRIVLRNEHERRGGCLPASALTMKDLGEIPKQYRELDALEKMDKALEIINLRSLFIGQKHKMNDDDFPYFHCSSSNEFHSILRYLHESGYTIVSDSKNPHVEVRLAAKSYDRLRALKRSGKDSRQCFVAMWFTPDMANVYENAIRPAIEYKEQGQSEPRFKALKIDQKEHTNDINDEIIAEIRKSRFMVCDLTGYRGGIYWEAGFAYGLGLEVIYTCRDDWIKPDTERLLLHDGTSREVKREGIHFDLEHRNRIQWNQEDLADFRDKLTKRIRAVIV